MCCCSGTPFAPRLPSLTLCGDQGALLKFKVHPAKCACGPAQAGRRLSVQSGAFMGKACSDSAYKALTKRLWMDACDVKCSSGWIQEVPGSPRSHSHCWRHRLAGGGKREECDDFWRAQPDSFIRRPASPAIKSHLIPCLTHAQRCRQTVPEPCDASQRCGPLSPLEARPHEHWATTHSVNTDCGQVLAAMRTEEACAQGTRVVSALQLLCTSRAC